MCRTHVEVNMRRTDVRRMLAIVSLAVLCGCAGQQSAPAVDQAAIGARIDSVNMAYNNAVAAKDTAAIVSLYADDAMVMPANQARAVGRDGIRQAWAGFLALPGLELKPTSQTKMISEAGDMVVDIGSFTFTMTGPDGKPINDVGKYVTIFKNVNGEWKIVVDMFNSDIPVTGP